ncbi:hypothetical protein [uncultured Photobacterium sp.]|uniref:hypothetical protein n=1 Tax=uncultured Photobacterium sp. TaxID=173973 RepID=UPI00260E9E98|nr:hypothetical protein [uncultured Photobacterium sp.]
MINKKLRVQVAVGIAAIAGAVIFWPSSNIEDDAIGQWANHQGDAPFDMVVGHETLTVHGHDYPVTYHDDNQGRYDFIAQSKSQVFGFNLEHNEMQVTISKPFYEDDPVTISLGKVK